MYLSKLEIVGFKSFANKVSLKFDSGVTAIVGPNGCGKTNVVDAIRWVLGEQKASTLRSDKMEDVIFNGTRNRKPLGMSEVSLTIENTRGILPTEYSEVTISRRVYRSGESEYLLNMVLCRLKDIVDLFMDTGMGADAYSVIELKMVEVILSDKTEERRRLFEEAAGVTKYKQRRKAAYRKLESVQQDLLRVNDIVKEVQKAVNSLERQAKKAETYNELATRLRILEIDLIEHEFAHLHSLVGPLQEKLSVSVEDKNRIDEELSRQETLLEVLQNELAALEMKLAEAQRGLTTQLEQIRSIEQKNLVAAEQVRSLTSNIERYKKEKIELTTQQQRLAEQKTATLRKRDEVTAAIRNIEVQYESNKTELDQLDSRLSIKKNDAKTAQDRVISFVGIIGAKKSEQEKIKSRIENISGRIDQLQEENHYYTGEIENRKTLVQELLNKDRELRTELSTTQVRIKDIDKQQQQLKYEIEFLRSKELDIQSSINRKSSRLDLLHGMIERHEGMTEGAKFLVECDEWKSALQMTVGDAMSTDEPYRIAIEAALGDYAQYFIVRSIEDAYLGIEILKKEHKGKATFICLDRVPAVQPKRQSLSGKGFIGWAEDLVKCNPEHSTVASLLLDGVAVVQDIDSAKSCLQNTPAEMCVTLDGQVVSKRGYMKGGSLRLDEGGLIGKKSQLEELQRDSNRLKEELGVVLHSIQEKRQQEKEIDTSTCIQELKNIEKEMTSTEMRIAQVEFEKRRAGESQSRNEDEIKRLQQEIAGLEGPLSEFTPIIQRLELERSEAEQALGVVQNEVEKLEADWNRQSNAVNQLSINIATLRGDERNCTLEIEHADHTTMDIAVTLEHRDEDIVLAREEISKRENEQEENTKILSDFRAELKLSEVNRDDIQKSYLAKKDEIHGLQMKLRDERLLHDKSVGATHDLEMKISELTMKAEHQVNRAKEEFDIDLQLKAYPPDGQFEFAAVGEDIRLAKEKLKSLGSVNFAAFEEYKTEKERLEFLEAQRSDLLEAEKTLLDTISEINTTAQQKFNDTFSQIRDNFIAIFKGLFEEGDECDLRLEENVDPLEAMIEIIAKPRGKRPTSIDLLSGGEKTLTAIALLFAIYLVKPSPFCILDEVDAPLDDSNIDRFTRIIRQFSDNTQFIVVTHNKRTMEAANAMYGVTMEEEGISKLVSVRFKEGAEVSAN